MTKPTKWPVQPVKTDRPGHPPSLIRVFAVRMKKASVLSYPLSSQPRILWVWVYAHADLSLCWTHSRFVGFVMRQLILSVPFLLYGSSWSVDSATNFEVSCNMFNKLFSEVTDVRDKEIKD